MNIGYGSRYIQFFQLTTGKSMISYFFYRTGNDGIAAAQNQFVCCGFNYGIAVFPAVVNKISFITMSGADVLELFGQMALVGGEGVSHSVRLVITKDGKLVSATINGQPVDPQKDYRLTTIDYLLGGTDKLEAFKKGRDVKAPKEVDNNTRFIIMNYFREMSKQGKEVDSEIEGRVVVK